MCSSSLLGPAGQGLPGEWRNYANSTIFIHTLNCGGLIFGWILQWQLLPCSGLNTESGHMIQCEKLKLPLSSSGAFCDICFITSQTQSCAQFLLHKALKSCHGRKKAVRAQKCFPPSSRHHVYDSRGCVVTAAGRRQLCPPRSPHGTDNSKVRISGKNRL